VKWVIRLENALTVSFRLEVTCFSAEPAFRHVRISVQGTRLGAPKELGGRGKSEYPCETGVSKVKAVSAR
jgi:hypothetical protein